jgi:uncharacterized protein (DUF433 family)
MRGRKNIAGVKMSTKKWTKVIKMDCPRVKGQVITYDKEKAKICLECPYETCLEEIETRPNKLYGEERIKREEAIVKDSQGGMVNRALAEKYRVSVRTIQDILRRRRKLDRHGIID